MPQTGRAVEVAADAMVEIEDGRVRRLAAVFDEAGMLRQLGVLQ